MTEDHHDTDPSPTDDGVAEDGADQTVSWAELLTETEHRLRSGGIGESAINARRIVEEASGFDGAELVEGLGRPATVGGVRRLDAMVARRLTGEPLQYVLGHWGFRYLDLMVDSRVLIPRPETEQVVEEALRELRRVHQLGREPVLVDLGTGSGAIGLSVAHEYPGAQVWLSDIAADALDVARANVAGLGRRGAAVRIVQGSWFSPLPAILVGKISVVVSNPPYVSEQEELPEEVEQWEPREALIGDDGGYGPYEVLIGEAARWLSPGGALVVESAPHQIEQLMAQAHHADAGFAQIRAFRDLSGRFRGIVATTEP